MKTYELLEARKNPELNPKISVNDEILRYNNAHRGERCYISFTALDKLGVNPSSLHGTPIGVYCYPLEYVIDRIGGTGVMKALPFAGSEKFANLFTVDGNVIDLDDITNSVLESYWKTLKKVMPSELLDELQELIDDSKHDAINRSPGGRFWYVVRACAMLIATDTNRQIAVVSTELFRKLGIDGIVDRNDAGIIHRNEPTQGVIFNPRVIKNVRRVMNKYSKDWMDARKEFGSSRKQETSV